MSEVEETSEQLKERAFDLYEPPFSYQHGYIFDANSNMVADEAGANVALRVRGWGRISYLDSPANLQDKAGELITEALTEFWEKHKND